MKKVFILFLVSSTLFSQAQTSYGDYKDAADLCIAIQGNSFSSDKAADNALDRILSVIGASKRFILQPCSEIDNAVAISYKGIRYILYDREFMNELNSNLNSWSSLSVLAHEVGHHINGHSLDVVLYATDMVDKESLAEQRQQELEADEFSGFIMAKLGASLNQASEAIVNLSSNSDDSYSTHPSRDKRLNAIRTGYNKGNTNNTPIANEAPTKLSAEDYFYRGLNKQYKGDLIDAIDDYTKAIGIKYNYARAYFNRGMAKFESKNYQSAILDFTKGIELEPRISNMTSTAYYNRGKAKENLENYRGALADYTKAIEIAPKDAEAFGDRGIMKYYLTDYNGALADYTKAIELNPNYAEAFNNRGNAKTDLEDYYGAIADYTKAIEIDPNKTDAYSNRGGTKNDLKDYNGAIVDLNKAIELNPDNATAYVNRGNAKKGLKNYTDALSDYNQALKLNPYDAIAYFNKGLLKTELEDYESAILDFTKAIELNSEDAASYFSRGILKYLLSDLIGACADWKYAKNLGYQSQINLINDYCN